MVYGHIKGQTKLVQSNLNIEDSTIDYFTVGYDTEYEIILIFDYLFVTKMMIRKITRSFSYLNSFTKMAIRKIQI